MTSKGAKETIVSRLGFKSSSGSSTSKAEAELDKVRKENAHLRKKIDELAKRHIKPPDSDKSKLLERILSLETLRERNNQQLLVKEQELEAVRQQLTAKGGEVVASLQAQLEQRRKEAEQRDALFQNLSQETENLKNKLATVSARCQSLETQVVNGQDMTLIQEQLKDALEKNQQWLMYDQQREAYVQSVHARAMELEQQLTQAKQEAGSEGETSQAELQAQKEQVTRVQDELLALQRKYGEKRAELSSLLGKHEEKSKALEDAQMQLQAERLGNRHAACEERKVSSERADRMRAELEAADARLEEERKRSAELLLQVLTSSLLRKFLFISKRDSQQIQLSAKDSENEKIDRQSMQHQLHKVLKELRKARDQIAKLESAKQPNARFSEPTSYSRLDFERLTIDSPPGPTSPSKVTSLLDESFLECPKCQASYPTSRHRELLAHIDYCLA
uniref:Centrosomal protein 55 like n=1 Tax=Salarias fasciatus TaxID=181472 RepID=A0A672JFT7_SALFA